MIKLWEKELKKVTKNCSSDSPLFSVKIILLKLMHDRGCYFDVRKNLSGILDDFRIDTILSEWAGTNIRLLKENAPKLDIKEKNKITNFILGDSDISSESETVLGYVYESALSKDNRKEQGITYTPEDIREYMTDIVRSQISVTDKLIDPACGCGWFLLSFYHALMNKYYESGAQLPIKELHAKILSSNIFGADQSEISCVISKISLSLLYPEYEECSNIRQADSLTESGRFFEMKSFDWVITNPPYIGHKKINPDYRKKLRLYYSEVFYDKADISYCFFKLGFSLLKENGTLLFITSRYFTQSQFAEGLRKFLLNNFTFRSVLDFFGIRPFKNIGIDPLILQLSKGYSPGNIFSAIKPLSIEFNPIDTKNSPSSVSLVSQDELKNGNLSFLSEEELESAKKISRKCSSTLEDYMISFQGIITGCDKAFVTEKTDELTSAAADECGVKWIKGKDIKEKVTFSGKYLLYTTDYSDIDSIQNTIRHLESFREQLSGRREVRRGIRKWYAVQWYRKREHFESPKIIFPYKSQSSRFLYDEEGYFFSADVYAMLPKEEYSDIIDMKKLAALLSSSIYDSYFKTFAKKLGGKLYEYYPNTVMKMKIPEPSVINSFESEQDMENYFSS